MANVKITDLTPGAALVGTELYESVQSAASVSITSDQIKAFASKQPTLTIEDSATNTPSTAATLTHTTSGTPAAGIGTRLDFVCETAAGNNEIGVRLVASTTDVTSGSEDFNLLIQCMTGGAAPTTAATITSDGDLRIVGDTVRVPVERTITNANDAGVKGDICWDSSYIYVCTATDTWKRVAIATWP
jgi:hypothetical protein